MLKQAVAGPIISRLLNHADQDLPNSQKPPNHHKDTDKSFLEALMEYENSFYKEKPILVQIVSKHVPDENKTLLAKCAREISLNNSLL